MTGETEEGQGLAAATPRLTLADLRGLTPRDLRDLSELRQEHAALQRAYAALQDEAARRGRDQAYLEDENRYLRAQLAEALAGWQDEQRRARRPQRPPAPDVEEVAPQVPRGPWGRLWAWLSD